MRTLIWFLWFLWFICVSDPNFHLACFCALLCEQEAGSFFIFKFFQLFLVFWEIWWLFYTVFPLIRDHTVTCGFKWLSATSTTALCSNVKWTSYSSGISLHVCIMDCDSGWCNNIVSASLIYSLCFPYCAISAQFSLAVIILYHFLTLPHSVHIGVYGCTNQSITAAGRKWERCKE